MKVRTGFISNSSSTSFVIHNKTNEELPLTEFVMETKEVIDEFIEIYGGDKTAKKLLVQMTKDAKSLPPLKPGSNTCIFGDEQGTTIGRVYDYALRRGGSTKRFGWSVKEWLR